MTNLARRDFIGLASAGMAGVAWGSQRATAAELLEHVPRFTSPDPAVSKLADDIYRQCVLQKIKAPEGTLKHRWLLAGTGNSFYGQWVWDTMFVADLLAVMPNKGDVLRDVFQNYWDFQQRWNDRKPTYSHDMIACMIEPGNEKWLDFPAYSQIPIIAWGMERVFMRNGDKELLKQGLAPLERFHEWFWRERDVTNVGLIAVGAYSGVIQHARWETFDYECNLDDLQLTKHPTRKAGNEGAWYGDILAAGNTAYLIMAERCLERLARHAGDPAMAARRKVRIDNAVTAMRKHMWDEKTGCFLSLKRDSLEKIPTATIGGWIALAADVPTKDMAARMADVLRSEHWTTPLPLRTVDRKDSRWKSDAYWRGDVWPAPNYQVASGLARYGHANLAAEIADKTVANALKNGISEHYDSLTGKPLGVPYLGMTCTIITMMLDGLCHQYAVQVENT